jgi:molybdenum-dependent DNA-binding transcriptional regulator ModE
MRGIEEHSGESVVKTQKGGKLGKTEIKEARLLLLANCRIL